MDEQEYMRKMQENERLYMYGDLNEGWTWWEANSLALMPHGRVEVWTRGGYVRERGRQSRLATQRTPNRHSYLALRSREANRLLDSLEGREEA
jgi:hypothetical protein